tara:strand:- start:13531 stop:14493 length:963 start_codon:yes stop_codon:yes gene_type:complete
MLSTKISKFELKYCIYNASGVHCKSQSDLSELYNVRSPVSIVLSKSCTLEERNGNAGPRYHEDIKKKISINSSGLPNYGYKYYGETAKYLKNSKLYIYSASKPFILSVSGMNINDNLLICQYANDNNYIDGIELNLSCPNVIGKPQIGYEFEDMENVIRKVKETIDRKFPIGLKLPPYFDISHYDKAASIINEFKIDMLTCINSVGNTLMVDSEAECVLIRPKKGMGGLGGSYIKPIALANVNYFYKNTKCDIIGCGGIVTGKDAFEHILCGASAVQLGTILAIEGMSAFDRIKKELIKIMVTKGYTNINDFKGKLKYFD